MKKRNYFMSLMIFLSIFMIISFLLLFLVKRVKEYSNKNIYIGKFIRPLEYRSVLEEKRKIVNSKFSKF
jgi:hypothetical protein